MKRKTVVSLMAAVAAVAIGAWALHQGKPSTIQKSSSRDAQQSDANVPPYYASLDGVDVPKTLSPQQFSNPEARKGYEIAEKIPKILMQMPCYCHCDVMGHKSLLDCFTGQHAAFCNICLDSAAFVYQRWQAGVPIIKIRQALIRQNSHS